MSAINIDELIYLELHFELILNELLHELILLTKENGLLDKETM